MIFFVVVLCATGIILCTKIITCADTFRNNCLVLGKHFNVATHALTHALLQFSEQQVAHRVTRRFKLSVAAKKINISPSISHPHFYCPSSGLYFDSYTWHEKPGRRGCVYRWCHIAIISGRELALKPQRRGVQSLTESLTHACARAE